MIKRVALVLFSVVWLAGCNTIAGMGKDISKAGDAITGASDKARK